MSRVNVDPVTFSVVWGGLLSAAAEMGVTLTRTAYSVAVREGSDFSTGMFDRHGRMVAQGDYSPGHLGSMAFAVQKMLAVHPVETLGPGDAVICNDPGVGSGHLPDIYMMCPVYHDGVLLGFAVNIAHQIDIGGSGAGSQTIAGIQDNYQEGIRFPPIKLFRNGRPVDALFKVIGSNVRVPEVLGDMRAQYNANITGARRLESLAANYGPEVVMAATDELIERSERQMREAIAALQPGTFTFEDRMDDVGPGTEPVEARVTVTIGERRIVVDWDGSGPQREAGMNSYLHYTMAYSIAAVKSVTLPGVPQNDGIIRTIEVRAPEGSFFNPVHPAPCGGRAVVSHRIYEVVMGALAKAAPDKVIAATSHFFNPNIGGTDPRTGKQFICWESVIGGIGARTDKDGVEATSSPWNGTNVPIEIQESRNPVIIEHFGLIEDSAGAGRFRGGCGMRRDVKVLADRATLYNLGDRNLYPPYGLHGGRPGAVGRTLLNPGTEREQTLGSKGTYRLEAGDVVSWRTSGAGGSGDALDRVPRAVLADVLDGLVSREAARRDYGVVIGAAGVLDEAATARERERRCAAPTRAEA